MGSSSSKKYDIPASYYGGIFSKLEKAYYFPGETLSGRIYLNLQNVYPGTKLILSFKGHEFVTWMDTESTGIGDDRRTESVRRKQKVKIYKQETELYNWSNESLARPGQYIFPVQFMIPPNLPGSFYYTQPASSVVAEIKYTMTVYLKPNNEEKIAKLKSKTGIVIREILRTAIQAQEIVMNKDVKCCCCFGKGNVSMMIRSEKNAYAPTEEMRLMSEIDSSQCSTSIQKVEAFFLQRITLKAGIYRKNIEVCIHKTDLGGIESGRQYIGSQAKTVKFQLPPGEEPMAIDYSNPDKTQKMANKTSSISPTTNGTIVKSEFYLKVTCKTGCCITSPNIELPIFIYAPVLATTPDPIPPSKWAPQQIPISNLVFTPDYYQGYVPAISMNNEMGKGNLNQPY